MLMVTLLPSIRTHQPKPKSHKNLRLRIQGRDKPSPQPSAPAPVCGGCRLLKKIAEHRSPHSHSMVPGGFDVTSYTTRLMPLTSLMMRVAAAARKPMSKWKKSAVMPSTEVTARSAQTNS